MTPEGGPGDHASAPGYCCLFPVNTGVLFSPPWALDSEMVLPLSESTEGGLEPEEPGLASESLQKL